MHTFLKYYFFVVPGTSSYLFVNNPLRSLSLVLVESLQTITWSSFWGYILFCLKHVSSRRVYEGRDTCSSSKIIIEEKTDRQTNRQPCHVQLKIMADDPNRQYDWFLGIGRIQDSLWWVYIYGISTEINKATDI